MATRGSMSQYISSVWTRSMWLRVREILGCTASLSDLSLYSYRLEGTTHAEVAGREMCMPD